MQDLLTTFERECTAEGIAPTDALKAGGVHPTLWGKWKNHDVSPTLKNFERARAGLRKLKESRAKAVARAGAAA